MTKKAFLLLAISGFSLLLMMIVSGIVGRPWPATEVAVEGGIGSVIALAAVGWLYLFFALCIWGLVRASGWVVKGGIFFVLIIQSSSVYWFLAGQVLPLARQLEGSSLLINKLFDGMGLSATWGASLSIAGYELYTSHVSDSSSLKWYARYGWLVISALVTFAFLVLRIDEIADRIP